MKIDSEGFRKIFGSLPTAVAVITSVDSDGNLRGVTSNTVTAVSKEPPSLLVCLDRGSQTLTAIRDHGFFVVNFLADTGENISQTFASKADDKFTDLEFLPAPHAENSPVLTADAIAHAECQVQSEIVVGDHSIIIGVMRSGSVYDRSPLMYHRRSYSSWPVARELAEVAES